MESSDGFRQRVRCRRLGRIKSAVVGLTGIISSSLGYGCTTIPSSREDYLRPFEQANTVEQGYDGLLSGQVGAYDNESGQPVVVSSPRGLDDAQNANRTQNGEWQQHEGDLEWEFTRADNGAYTSTWYETTNRQRRQLLEHTWTPDGDETLTRYNYDAQGSATSTSLQPQGISRAKLQARYYAALRNAGIRSYSGAQRAGRLAYRVLLGKRLSAMPIGEWVLGDPNRFEFGEQDAAGGLAEFYGSPSIGIETTGYAGLVPRFVTRSLVNMLRLIWTKTEQGRREGRLPWYGYPARGIISIFQGVDNLVDSVCGIDREVYRLFVEWDNPERLFEDQFENAFGFAEKAVGAAVVAAGGSSGGGGGASGGSSGSGSGTQGGFTGGDLGQ